jgi:hypothetical protein
MRRRLGYLLVLMIACAVPASSQVLGTGVLPVTEVGPTAMNATITAIESTISAIEDVIQSAYMLLELTPLDDIAIAADFAETMGILAALVEEGMGLMGDAEQAQAQIEALFGLEAPPRNLLDLNERMGEIKMVVFETRRYAIRVQTLISSINSAVGHIIRIMELVGGLVGNMQGNRALHQAVLYQGVGV